MAFDVSGLSAWVDNNSKEIVMKAIMEAKTPALLKSKGRFMAGVKAKEQIRLMDGDIQVQLNDGCARNPIDTIVLGVKEVTVTPLKSESNFCPKTLRNTIYAQNLVKGQSPNEVIDNELASAIVNLRSTKLSALVEDMLWKSDLTVTGTTNFNKFDGIKKQVGAGTAITPSGSGIIAQLKSFYLSIPVLQRSQEDFLIFISPEDHEEYISDMDTANKYREESSEKLSGTTGKFFITPGLSGSGKVYATRVSNIVYAVDGEGDETKTEFYESKETRQFYSDFYWAMGVKVLTPSEVYVASI